MKSLRFLERGKSRKAMKVMKVRRKSSYPMGTTKCMRVRRTNKIHSWGRISGHVDDWCGKLIRCMRRSISNRRGRLRQRGGRLFKKKVIGVMIPLANVFVFLGMYRNGFSLKTGLIIN